ncbi:MAG: 2'-5' RNA ligase [Candidatus Aminicenantes bacterium RBG_13_63_10]|nr:MAG: 2'-5' RNA ligase [Candidatus Aminicenantes bacterium RBG_13_63_10]
MRTFIALELTPEIKAGLDRLVRSLAPLTRDIRWVRPEGMHLTLKFLGEISEDRAARVAAALRGVSSQHGPVSLTVSGTGWFPAPSRRPRVIWTGVESGQELGALYKDLERALAAEGFPEESRPFHPHLTLGRVKAASNMDALLDRLKENAAATFGRMAAGEITFFESRLQPSGAVYAVLERFPLK